MSSLSKECDKAAHILKGFIGKISLEVIAKAKGLAIFSGFRAAMWMAGSGGSGVVMARLPDGRWSAPSAFSVISGGFGLALGLDVFDCVCVLNTQSAVDAYTKAEVNLGADVSVAAGPVGGTADISGAEVKPIWTYVKSHGLYASLAMDGTVIRERPNVNQESYGKQIKVNQILQGMVDWPATTQLPGILKDVESK